LTADLIKALEDDFERKWQSFLRAGESAAVAPPQHPQVLESLKRVFAFSDFVAASSTRDPALLADLIASADLLRPFPQDEYRQLLQAALAGVADENELSRRLRCCRRREWVRIAWRDLAGWANLSETIADLSNFADACLDQTLDILYQWQCTAYGVPTGSNGAQQRLIILGLGKLGARELNFSSDVDLIFAYPQTGETQGAERSISNDDFFTRLCRRLIKIIGQPTPDGFMFRVDLRLRPFGESGPLVMSFDALEQYYQEQGREWERYALIKARVVAGDKEFGARLLERLRPFIYRRYLDYSAFESLREMKEMIALEVKRKGLEKNIKIGPGGIREIEFFGQMFQLIRGGVTPLLQQTGIQAVLEVLVAEGYIPERVFAELNQAYIFLRKIENRLQAFADQQTHDLPSDPLGQQRLAASMGFPDPKLFEKNLAVHRHHVHAHFQMLLDPGDSETQHEETEKHLGRIWQNVTDSVQARKILVAMGYFSPDQVLRLLDYLRNDPETRALSPRGRQRLNKLIPLLLKQATRSDYPDATLGRIIDLIKTIERRTSYLALLLENPTALTHLVKLSNASPWITTFLSQHPVLLDELLDPRTLYRPPALNAIGGELRRRMDQIAPADLEYQIEELCIFKQVNVLRIAAADVTGMLPLMRVSDHLSEVAASIVQEVTEIAWNHLVAKHGMPASDCPAKGFAVIAYGKLGGLELGYGSDLDLVFLHAGTPGQTRGGPRPIDNTQFYNRLGQRVIHILTSHTRAGKIYEIDMRLRPSGNSGILVSHVNSFGDYQMKAAWTWEHQALIKARPICGEKFLTDRFEKIRSEAIGRPRDKTNLQEEVIGMRERMRKELLRPQNGIFDLKQDRGGMVDIEFLVQYLVLLTSHLYPGLLQWTDNVRLLQTLMETGVVDEYTAHLLKHAYLIYRAASHQLSLQEKPAKVPEERFSRLRNRVQEICSRFFEAG
jgi:[glutamine synthetase] adenylyltransferase / [glutamine synthetase]-adenylyl-L-tyrosine phosphorylase